MVNKPNSKVKTKSSREENGQQGEKVAKKQSFKRVSEYGKQLAEKQKLKEFYGMREKQFRRFYANAIAQEGVSGENLLTMLERRLDNVVYRLKMATSCAQARQMIVHGHILVNNHKVTKPSYLVLVGDVISLHKSTLEKAKFIETVVDKRMNIGIKVPEWLELVKQNKSGKVLRYPARSDVQYQIEEYLIVEFYSK